MDNNFICSANGWSLVQLNNQSGSWYDNVDRETLKGAIGITINDHKDTGLFFTNSQA